MSKPQEYTIQPIGVIHTDEKENKTFSIEIYEKYRPALLELENFTHAHIFWWAHLNDTPNRRKVLQSEELPEFYGKDAPTMGVFANRSEFRPNPIGLSTCPILSVDKENGIIRIPWIDAVEGTPLVDIKPYLPMADLIEKADYPKYLQHWPRSAEKAIIWFEQRWRS